MGDLPRTVSLIENEISAGTFPGAALAVNIGGKRIFERYWGTYCSTVQQDNRLDGSVIFPLFSFSKAISATVVAVAHQRRFVDYDAPLLTYIPEYRGYWKSQTTIRHLLTHSAGIPNCPQRAAYTEEQWNASVRSCCETDVEWPPGSRTTYHWASGILLVAEAVRRSMGGRKTWNEICRELLLDPIELYGLSLEIPPVGTPVALSPQPEQLPCFIDPSHNIAL